MVRMTNCVDLVMASRTSRAAAGRVRQSGDEILRLAHDEGFDIVYQLIGEKLHGTVAGPGDVGCQNEVRPMKFKQRVAFLRRLLGEDVKAGARDQSLLQRLPQRLLIHQAAPSRIDQNGRAFHLSELIDADHVASLFGQRQVQRNHVAFRQYLFEWGEYDTGCLRRSMIRKQHLHSEAAGNARRSLAEDSLTDDAYGCAVKIANRMVKEAELIGPLPPAILNIPAISKEIAS